MISITIAIVGAAHMIAGVTEAQHSENKSSGQTKYRIGLFLSCLSLISLFFA